MVQVTITLVDSNGNIVNDSSVTVAIDQDELLQGYTNIANERPDANGNITFDGSTLTNYRVSASGLDWDTSELPISIGFDVLAPQSYTLTMNQKIIPYPSLSSETFTNWFRGWGLAQSATAIALAIAIAAIVIGVAYITGKTAPIVEKVV